ncbi:MAG TPA: ABC transporter substrate-binding protein [Acidocella sp.]|nr:ABC transporter substrate-binding protein [Acidocella sp.]
MPHAAPAAITVTDMAGRKVTLAAPPQRIALQDGRIALDLALLDRAHPFARVVVWNNLLRRFDPNLWSVLVKHWPGAANIPDMGFDDNGSVNLEETIAERPQLLVAELRARPVLEQQGVMRTLAQLGIPVLFVDDTEKPVPDAARSVALLGQVLGRAAEAKAYVDFYDSHLASLDKVIAAQPKPRPLVFVNVLAGENDAGTSCFTHGNFGWGLLVQAVGARNLGAELLRTPAGQVSMEAVLAAQPDVMVMTGRAPSDTMVSLGYNTSAASVRARLRALAQRPGFGALEAVRDDRVYGLYHPFYSSVFNIIGLEYLAKFIYPQAFTTLHPAQDYASIIAQFTDIPTSPVLLGMRMPANGG